MCSILFNKRGWVCLRDMLIEEIDKIDDEQLLNTLYDYLLLIEDNKE